MLAARLSFVIMLYRVSFSAKVSGTPSSILAGVLPVLTGSVPLSPRVKAYVSWHRHCVELRSSACVRAARAGTLIDQLVCASRSTVTCCTVSRSTAVGNVASKLRGTNAESTWSSTLSGGLDSIWALCDVNNGYLDANAWAPDCPEIWMSKETSTDTTLFSSFWKMLADEKAKSGSQTTATTPANPPPPYMSFVAKGCGSPRSRGFFAFLSKKTLAWNSKT